MSIISNELSTADRECLVSAINKIDWDTFFMYRAFQIAMQSPDAQTKQGVILVDTSTHRVISEGFNGFPPGSDDENLPTTRPEKYDYMVHCEPNAFNWAARLGARFDDVTAYITMFPCETCVRNHIIATSNLKIKRIVYWEDRDFLASKKMLAMRPDILIEKFDGGVERIINSGAVTFPIEYIKCTPQSGRTTGTNNYSRGDN